MVRRRPFSEQEKSYMAFYETAILICELPSPVPVGVEGRMRIDSLADFQVSTNAYIAPSAKKDDVVCSRGVYGDIDFLAVVRFAEFYLERWKFSRVIVYEVGLSNLLTSERPDVAKRIAQLKGRLIVVDLRTELQRMYGRRWHDVVFTTASVFQMSLKGDCMSRAKALGARWTLHVDLDEYMFSGNPEQHKVQATQFPTFSEWADATIPDVGVRFSMGVERVQDKSSVVCKCGRSDGTTDWLQDFVSQTFEDHQVALEAAPNRWDPFVHGASGSQSFQGKRKMLLRLDHERVETSYITVHSLMFGFNRLLPELPGRDADPFKELYMREYMCVNTRICRTDHRAEREWFY
jgi:hypothetical protein